MKIKEVISALERFAPLPLQDGYDNAGVQVGLTEAEATGALLCLDVTESVVDEAVSLGYNLIVAHHPILFKGYKSLTGSDYVQRCIIKAIQHSIVIYAAHTNLDNARGGVNYQMAERIGLQNVRVLEPKENALLKLVTFVPVESADSVRNALFNSGCGCIGDYDSCSYNLQGEGTFKAHPGTHPYCGQINQLHIEKEVRIETILPAYQKSAVIRALLQAHPYEEPAYDLYPLQNSWMQAGAGVLGTLPQPEDEETFLRRIKDIFKVGCVKHSPLHGKKIQTVALCGGAGGFLASNALRAGADVYITGEMKYHDYFYYEDKLLVAEIGHYESEQYIQELFKSIIKDAYPELPVNQTSVYTNPINYL